MTFGEWDRCNKSAKPSATRLVVQAILNNYSNDFKMDNDIALLRLNDSVPIVNITKPVCLPTVLGKYQTLAGKINFQVLENIHKMEQFPQ